MVENQHQKISGYRDLTEREIGFINAIKGLHHEVGELWLQALEERTDADQRDLELARDRLNEGFFWFVRAVARPADPFDPLNR